jgi:hypothetical protein
MAKESGGCGTTLVCAVVAGITLVGSCAIGTSSVGPGNNNTQNFLGVIFMFGAVPFAIVAFVVTALLMAKAKENVEAERERQEKEESERASERTRAAMVYDFAALDKAFEQNKSNATAADMRFINGIVYPILNGDDIGKDEFERREYGQIKQRMIQEHSKLFLAESDGKVSISEYDFEEKRFSIQVTLNDITVFNPKAGRTMKTVKGFLAMDEEPAKTFRRSTSSTPRVRIVIRASSVENHPRFELVGLQIG